MIAAHTPSSVTQAQGLQSGRRVAAVSVGVNAVLAASNLVVGARGDGDPSGRGTSLMIFDPWEPNAGRRWRVSYYSWVTEVITRTYRLFQQ